MVKEIKIEIQAKVFRKNSFLKFQGIEIALFSRLYYHFYFFISCQTLLRDNGLGTDKLGTEDNVFLSFLPKVMISLNFSTRSSGKMFGIGPTYCNSCFV
jgi:hypothetical protein